MKLNDLKAHLYTEYLADDAAQDGASIVHLDDAPECDDPGPNAYIVCTDDAGAVLCEVDPQHLLVGVYTADALEGCEAYPDKFIAWMRSYE